MLTPGSYYHKGLQEVVLVNNTNELIYVTFLGEFLTTAVFPNEESEMIPLNYKMFEN